MITRSAGQSLAATHIGPLAQAALAPQPRDAAVLSAHRQVVNLMTPTGDLLTLAAAAIGAGPFNIILERWPSGMKDLAPGLPVAVTESSLQVGTWCINLEMAQCWPAPPTWGQWAQAPALAEGIGALRRCLAHEPAWPLTRQLDRPTAHVLQTRVGALLQASTATEQADALATLIGLGPGLTPAGDDWLAGWLIRWRLDAARAAAPPLRTADLARTTRLSQALLRAACAGWVDAAWQGLLAALSCNHAGSIQQQARHILQHGATSGCAMLAGFLHSI
jgi:hypothetical protein